MKNVTIGDATTFFSVARPQLFSMKRRVRVAVIGHAQVEEGPSQDRHLDAGHSFTEKGKRKESVFSLVKNTGCAKFRLTLPSSEKCMCVSVCV